MSQDHAVQTFLARYRRLWLLIPLLVLAFLILLVGFILPGLGRSSRGLKPFRPSPTPGELALDGQAAVVTFTDLNDSPDTYRNQRIRDVRQGPDGALYVLVDAPAPDGKLLRIAPAPVPEAEPAPSAPAAGAP